MRQTDWQRYENVKLNRNQSLTQAAVFHRSEWNENILHRSLNTLIKLHRSFNKTLKCEKVNYWRWAYKLYISFTSLDLSDRHSDFPKIDLYIYQTLMKMLKLDPWIWTSGNCLETAGQLWCWAVLSLFPEIPHHLLIIFTTLKLLILSWFTNENFTFSSFQSCCYFITQKQINVYNITEPGCWSWNVLPALLLKMFWFIMKVFKIVKTTSIFNINDVMVKVR